MKIPFFYKKSGTFSRRIASQCAVTLMLYFLFLLGGFFMARFICSLFIWEYGNPLYHLLKMIEAFSPVIIFLLALLGVFFIVRHYFLKSTGYIEEIIGAAKQMTEMPEHPVSLSEELHDTENELNIIREHAISNALMAKDAEQRKNDLVMYLAHDLKTPLTSVIGYLTLLRDAPELPSEQRANYTDIALEKAERLEELINEFFDITRFSLSTLELQKQTVNLSRMLEQIAYESKPVLEERGLYWNMQTGSDVQVLCDPDKFERVVDNLIRNAVAYSYENTEITIILEEMDSQARIRIENHGKTIPPEKLSRLFEQFFRLDTSRASSTGGAGLGLAIAKEIVEAHGGSLSAESENEIICFTVILPHAS